MKKQHCVMILLCVFLFLAGCDNPSGSNASPTPTPTATPTPVVTMEPTSSPDLPETDPSLLSFADVRLFAWEEWPASCRMRFMHSSGNVVEATGVLAQGDGFTIYLLQGLAQKSFDHFIVEGSRVYPQRNARLDTGEGILVTSTDADAASALAGAIAEAEDAGYAVSARHGMEDWAGLYGFSLEPERGAVSYDGEFAILEHPDHFIRRILALDSGNGVYLVTLEVYEAVAEPPMFQYLCSMLASIHFQQT